MVSMKQFIKKVLNVKDCVIEDVRLSPRYNEPFVIQIVLHPKKSLQKICPPTVEKSAKVTIHVQSLKSGEHLTLTVSRLNCVTSPYAFCALCMEL